MNKLSIVIPYYNRRRLLWNTLESISHYKKDYPIEIIIVDDGSKESQTIDDIPDIFPDLNIKLIVLKRDNTEQRTPVVSYNTGFNAVTGDAVLINCAECMHLGDIIGYVFANLRPKTYIAFSTYCGTDELNVKLNTLNWKDTNVINTALNFIKPFSNGWHSHSTHETYIPFCAAINRDDLEILSGYDERFITGIGYDDYDFTDRVENLGLWRTLVDEPFCIHQMHPKTVYSNNINLDFLWHLRRTEPKRIKAIHNQYYCK
jgi:glycosyltransferase involved in cell wall biosynthesis